MKNETELRKIKCHYDADNFFYWLREHPEVTEVQGWEIKRHDNNSVISFGTYYADHDWMWESRKIFNDWIDRKLAEAKLAEAY